MEVKGSITLIGVDEAFASAEAAEVEKTRSALCEEPL